MNRKIPPYYFLRFVYLLIFMSWEMITLLLFEPSFEDQIIPIASVLMILSLLTEKTTQFIRNFTKNANYLVIAVIFLLEVWTLVYLFSNSDSYGCSFRDYECWKYCSLIATLIIFLIFNCAFIFFSQILKKTVLLKLRGQDFNILRASVLVIIVTTAFFHLFYSIILLGEVFFLLACVSLSIIRLRIPKHNKAHSWDFTFLTIRNIDYDNPNSKYYKDKASDPDINFLAFLTGFFYAAIFGLNLLDTNAIFNTPQSPLIFSPLKLNFQDLIINNINGKNLISSFLGYVFAGFFLSFGSKFFHDLLDLLFFAKKAKQATRDPKFQNLQSADEVVTFVEDYQIRYHLDEKRAELHSIPEVYGSGIIEDVVNGKLIKQVQVCATKDLELETLFVTNSKSGDKVKIPYVLKRVNGPAIPQGSILEKKLTIYNDNNLEGSFSLVVDLGNPKEKFLLTCYHVVKHRNHDFHEFKGNQNNIIKQESITIGELYKGEINSVIDAALVKLDSNINLQNFAKKSTEVASFKYRPKENDQVSVFAQKTHYRYFAWIKAVYQTYTISYKDENGPDWELSYLFSISDYGPTSITHPGDSGGCVFKGDEPIGMIVALEDYTQNANTLVIPLYKVFKEFNMIKNFYPLLLN